MPTSMLYLPASDRLKWPAIAAPKRPHIIETQADEIRIHQILTFVKKLRDRACLGLHFKVA